MAAASRVRPLLAAVATAAAFACAGASASGSSGPAIEPGSSDLFELVVHFQGPWAQIVGTPHEWWSPATGFYRADHSSAREPYLAIYDGTSVTSRRGGKLFRVEGEAVMLRYLASRASVFELPAIAAVRRHVRHERSDALHVTARDGGRSFDVDIHYRDENGVDEHIRYTVEVRQVLTLADARAQGLLRPLTGRLAGMLKQSRPGTRPHFGQAGYWFGPTLGKARATTLLEQRGVDPIRGDGRLRPPSYTTIYRFAGATPADYPGLGTQGPGDVRLECRARERGFLPGVPAGAKLRPFKLADGTRAALYFEPYTLGPRSGIYGSIVVGRTACFIHGLVPPGLFVRLAPTLRRA
jgi:hypothetical protein